MEKQQLLNTYVSNLDMDETLAAIEGFIEEKKNAYVVAINVALYEFDQPLIGS